MFGRRMSDKPRWRFDPRVSERDPFAIYRDTARSMTPSDCLEATEWFDILRGAVRRSHG